MNDPLPLISCGTRDDDERDSFREHVRKIAKPIFDAAVAQEKKPNTMGIAPRVFSIVWRPNNYRLRMRLSWPSDSGIKSLVDHYQNVRFTKKGLAFVYDYDDVVLQVGPRWLIGIYAQHIINGVKETFLIRRNSMREVEEAVSAKADEIGAKIRAAMLDFLKRFDCALPGASLEWARYEDWIKGEDVIDSIPVEAVIHDTVFKKVYGEGIEFKQSPRREAPGVHLKQYIKNRAVEDIAPEIAGALDELRFSVDGLRSPESRLLELKSLIVHFPEDLLRVDVADRVRLLSPPLKSELWVWLFETFGGVPR